MSGSGGGGGGEQQQPLQHNLAERAQEFRTAAAEGNVDALLELLKKQKSETELLHTAAYTEFLTHMFPVYLDYLQRSEPQFVHSGVQQVRNLSLEILNRLPASQPLADHVSTLLNVILGVLKEDNEDNAVVCLRLIFNVYKSFHPPLNKAHVDAFLDFFTSLYENIVDIVRRRFDPPEEAKDEPLVRSRESFKVLTECPLIVMLMFQLYGKEVEPKVNDLIPLQIEALKVIVPPNYYETPEMRAVWNDLLSAQIKTLSFLTYVLRNQQSMKKAGSLCVSVISLLKVCPLESTSARKELLVATRHILATPLVSDFSERLDEMLDERLLVGSGNEPSHNSLRPLAYSTLMDLIHNVRKSLKPDQFAKVIHIFSRTVHDPTLPVNLQVAATRLLLNLVDHIYAKPPRRMESRGLLVRIVGVLVTKFETLEQYIPRLLARVDAKIQHVATQKDGDWWSLGYSVRNERDFPEDNVDEIKQLVYTVIFGLKTVMWCISNFQLVANTNEKQKAVPISTYETSLVTKFLARGLNCFRVFEKRYLLPMAAPSKAPTHDAKDALEQFASVFTVLDERRFRNVFSSEIASLFEQIVSNQNLPMLIIPQHFLSSASSSKAFADIMLSYLVKHMDQMRDPIGTSPRSVVMLSLFRLLRPPPRFFSSSSSSSSSSPSPSPSLSPTKRRGMALRMGFRILAMARWRRRPYL